MFSESLSSITQILSSAVLNLTESEICHVGEGLTRFYQLMS